MFDVRIGRRVMGLRYESEREASEMAIRLAYQFPGTIVTVVERIHSGDPAYRDVEHFEMPTRPKRVEREPSSAELEAWSDPHGRIQ